MKVIVKEGSKSIRFSQVAAGTLFKRDSTDSSALYLKVTALTVGNALVFMEGGHSSVAGSLVCFGGDTPVIIANEVIVNF